MPLTRYRRGVWICVEQRIDSQYRDVVPRSLLYCCVRPVMAVVVEAVIRQITKESAQPATCSVPV